MLVYYGTFLEFFEFVLFAIMFPVLSKSLSAHFSLSDLATLQYGLFWVGFLGRPLGALLLCPFGHRISRKRILVISVMGMAFSTMLLGCVPFTINPWITICYIAFFRLLQGGFTGVEYAVATIYLYEMHDKNRSKQSRSIVYLGVMAALGTGSAYMVGGFCHLEYLSVIHFWRAAFILVGFLSLWTGGLRLSRLSDDFLYLTAKKEKILSHFKFKKNIVIMISAFFLVGMSFGPWYYLTTFLNTYGVVLMERDPALAYFFNAGICVLISCIIYGIVHFQKKRPATGGQVCVYYLVFIALLAPASYGVFYGHMFYSYVILQILLAISSQLIVVNVIPLVPSLFPLGSRLPMFAGVQTLASSILGGGAPLMCHWLSMTFGSKVYASVYPIGLSVISLICYRWIILQRQCNKERILSTS